MVHINHEDTTNYVELCYWAPETGEWFTVGHHKTDKEAMEAAIEHPGRYRRRTITETIIEVTE